VPKIRDVDSRLVTKIKANGSVGQSRIGRLHTVLCSEHTVYRFADLRTILTSFRSREHLSKKNMVQSGERAAWDPTAGPTLPASGHSNET